MMRQVYKNTVLAVLVLATFFAMASGELDEAQLIGTTDKARAIDYEPGETMTFTLTLKNAKPFTAGAYEIRWTRTGDDGQKTEGKAPLSAETPLVVKTSLDRPGFVRLVAEVYDAAGKLYRKELHVDASTPEGKQAMNRWERADKRVFFDGGAGVHPEKLESVPEPGDYDEFWAKRKARLAKVPMNPVVKLAAENAVSKVYTFTVSCAGPRPVTGWYTVPKAPGKYPATISFHGYGAHFVQTVPTGGPAGRITMFINAHGYELGREDEYYTEFYDSIKSNGKTFAMDSDWQNKSTDTAYFGWMCYRIMRALEFIKSFPEWDGRELEAQGGSMGGLQTIWAAGLDPDVNVAKPSIPWCCDMGGRETLKRNSPSWGLRETEALRYFDPVNMAKRVSRKCKFTVTRAGLGDYVCPPSGIAVMYNNLPCDKTINWVQGSTHGHVPPDGFGNQQFTLHEGNAALVNVIFDTDMLSDFDDVGALACLHALADAGECEILATISSTRGNASVGAVEVINHYYGRPDIPVGAPKGMGVMGPYPGAKSKVDPASPLGGKTGGDGGHYKYRKLLADYPGWFRHADADNAPDANEVYRRVLAAQPDGSVTICSVGFLTNMRRLLETKPDDISPLDGKALVAKKVKLWVAMACSYPNGREYNSMWDAESSRIALENWPTPIVFSDFQYGRDCFAGRAIAESPADGRNPVRDVFVGNIPSRDEIRANSARYLQGCFGMGGRAAWDETAVLVAVRGTEPYFNVERGTYRMVGTDGADEWAPDAENGPHLRITEKLSKAEVGRIIDELICRKR